VEEKLLEEEWAAAAEKATTEEKLAALAKRATEGERAVSTPLPEAPRADEEEGGSSPQCYVGDRTLEDSTPLTGSAPEPSRGPAARLGEGGATWTLEVTGGPSDRTRLFQATIQVAHKGIEQLGARMA
jgi:hypothetical protein